MNYSELKKLDEESLANMVEGTGPIDECICSLISPPDDGERRSFGASIKKAFASLNHSGKRKKGHVHGHVGHAGGHGHSHAQRSIDIPLVYSKGESGVYSSKEAIKRNTSCGKCGCDNENIVLKHSYANIRITTPDISSVCPCPTDCLPEAQKQLLNNIKVTVERLTIDPDSENSETSLHHHKQKPISEPPMSERKSVNSLINAQYEQVEENLLDR